MNRFMIAAGLGLALVASGSVDAKDAKDYTAADIKVRKAIEERLTPAELAAYKERLAQNIREGRLETGGTVSRVPAVSGDTCPTATFELGPLPFNNANTTVGLVDNYDLPADVTGFGCTAPTTTCTGGGAPPDGSIYTGTGTAPDRAYRIHVSANCPLTIAGTDTSNWDLSVIIYQTQCSSSLADCVCVDDTNFPNSTESVALNALSTFDYFIVIDGYITGGVPPGPSGTFNLAVTTNGACTLVPVELIDFNIG